MDLQERPIADMITGEKLRIALMQDTLIKLIYDHVQPDAILYGGTAIWRCYNGGRFSEDIDIYVNKSFAKSLEKMLNENSLEIVWRDPKLPLHMKISDGKTDVLLEAGVSKCASSIVQYTKVDGSSMTITSLQAAELFIRKMKAYEGRRYIRDIYDIVHLTNYVRKDDYHIHSRLKPFLSRIKKPVDERILRPLIHKGPENMSFQKMVEYLKTWTK